MNQEFQIRLTRQMDLIPLEKLGEPITIIGAGAVGSWLALALAKMGFGNMTIFDDDTVDLENMNCSLYRPVDVGQKKVQALQNLIHQFTGLAINAQPIKYEKGVFPGIVVSAVDSMAVRKLIWDQHVENAVNTRRIIDPRMGAETALLYVMSPFDEKDKISYAKLLYTDDAAVHEPCTRKATAYCALPLAGLVAAQIKALVTESPYSRMTQWDIPSGGFQAWSSKK